MGCNQSKRSIEAYYDLDGSFIQFEHPKSHSAKKELNYVKSEDKVRFQVGEACYIISAEWHTTWIEFVTKVKTNPPGPISNESLLTIGGGNLRSALKHAKHFRNINKSVWEFYFRSYGGGPVITFKVPEGRTEEEYLKGTWIKKVNLNDLVTIIVPNAMPAPMGPSVTNPISRSSENAGDNVSLAANLMLNDLSKKKFQQAKELQKEINASNAEAIGAQMAKDMGKRKMAAANELEKQQHAENAGAVGQMFAGELAKKKLQEAADAKAQGQQAQAEQAAMVFTKGSVKKQFKAALASGNRVEMEQLAATMLKNAWRGKKARERARLLKEKRQRLLEEGMARKLQSKYRCRLARRKVQKLKEEKQRLREEGCAIIVQSNWRIRKARQKVQRLKIEKQRLLEEGAALKVQSRWRIKQAKARMGNIRKEKDKIDGAKVVIKRLVSVLKARLQFKRTLGERKMPFVVILQSAKDINVADNSTSDPYVLLHVESRNRRPNPTHGKPGDESHPAAGPTYSLYRTKTISSTLHPVWNETCLAANVSKQDRIVFTMMDHDTFSKDDFLGQVIFDVSKYPQLYSGKKVSMASTAINSFSITLQDINGKNTELNSVDTPGKGELSFSIQMARFSRSHCGWVLKQATQMIKLMGPAPYKSRYLVLLDGVLSYYDNELSLEHPRGILKCADITAISYEFDKSGELTLSLKPPSGEEWHIRWHELTTEQDIGCWLRKIQYACPKVTVNNATGPLYRRLETIAKAESSVSRSVSTASASPDKSSRRRSVFGF